MFSLRAHYNLCRKVIMFTFWTVHRWLSSNGKSPRDTVPRWNSDAASWSPACFSLPISAPVSAYRRLCLLPWAAGEHFADKLGGAVSSECVIRHVVKFWNVTIFFFLFAVCAFFLFFFLSQHLCVFQKHKQLWELSSLMSFSLGFSMKRMATPTLVRPQNHSCARRLCRHGRRRWRRSLSCAHPPLSLFNSLPASRPLTLHSLSSHLFLGGRWVSFFFQTSKKRKVFWLHYIPPFTGGQN